MKEIMRNTCNHEGSNRHDYRSPYASLLGRPSINPYFPYYDYLPRAIAIKVRHRMRSKESDLALTES